MILVTPTDVSKRLDRLLADHYPDHSRTYFQYLIEEGFVLINGQSAKKRAKPAAGDEIEICFQLTPELSFEPEEIPLDILYEDEHLLAINKPAGMVVHPAPGHYSGTFVNALLYHCKWQADSSNLRPGIVHRLDKDTSGILLAAKTSEAHQRLVSLFSLRRVKKYYLALCIGNPGNGEIIAPIGRHPVRRKEMAIVETGKEAISRCQVLKEMGKFSLVQVELVTGRTHQIRVHMKHRQTPILGDQVYGIDGYNKKFNVERQLLHAHQLQCPHPITGELLNLEAPVPADLQKWIEL